MGPRGYLEHMQERMSYACNGYRIDAPRLRIPNIHRHDEATSIHRDGYLPLFPGQVGLWTTACGFLFRLSGDGFIRPWFMITAIYSRYLGDG